MSSVMPPTRIHYRSTNTPKPHGDPLWYRSFRRIIAVVGICVLIIPFLPLLLKSPEGTSFYSVVLPILIEAALLMTVAILQAIFAVRRFRWLQRMIASNTGRRGCRMLRTGRFEQ